MRRQQVLVRAYNIPQRTDRQSFYIVEAKMYSIARKLIGRAGFIKHSFKAGYDKQRGEYTQLMAFRTKQQHFKKDLILWLNCAQ